MSIQFFPKTRLLLVSGSRRLVRARGWVVLQFIGLAVFIAAGLAWTRIPEKYTGQVILTLAVPVVIAALLLALQSATLRSLLRPFASNPDTAQHQVNFVWGAVTLLLWIAAGWLLWLLVDRFDQHVYEWASYLNSRFASAPRAQFATYAHLLKWLGYAAWALRWVIVPGVLIPLGCSARFGLIRIPWNRMLRVWFNWRWWPAVLVLALVGEAWPQTFFEAQPAGSVHAQVWRVILKLLAAYLLAALSWVTALAWVSALLKGVALGTPDMEVDESTIALVQGRPLPPGSPLRNIEENS